MLPTSLPWPDADVDVRRGAGGDLQGQASSVQSAASGNTAEATLNESIGNEGTAVRRGGAAGVADNAMGNPSDFDAAGEVGGSVGIEDAQGRASVDGSVQSGLESTGYRDPTTEAGRAEVLGMHAEGDVRNRVDVAGQTSDTARGVADDPTGSAGRYAEDRASETARDKAEGAAPGTVAQVQVAQDDMRNPEQAVTQEAESRVDQEKREVQVSVGVDAGADTAPRGPGDDSGTKK